MLDILNRAGIILNLLAGFMLAPDLIGRSKILSFEQKVENKINPLIDRVKADLEKNLALADRRNIVKIFVNTTGIYIIGLLIVVGLLGILVGFIGVNLLSNPRILGIIGALMLASPVMGFGILLWIDLTPRFSRIILLAVLQCLLKISNHIEKFIKEDETVLTLLTFGGIVFFIVGNMFQFIATFK
jgi:hypothetical protein